MKLNVTNTGNMSTILESYIPARYYTNEYYKDEDHWVLRITRRRDNVITYVKLDESDVEKARQHSWYPHHDPSKPANLIYIKSTGGLRLHRVITDCPKDKVVDHINHDPLDNRRSNIRICDVGDNNRNMSISKRNTTGVVGVRYRKDRGTWVANKMINGVLHAKQFKTFEEAVEYKNNVLDKLI